MTPERMDELWEQVPSCDLARDERHWYADMIAREARREALEEAARVCEHSICGARGFAGPSCCLLPPGHVGKHIHGIPRTMSQDECAAAIRALADAPAAGARKEVEG